MDANKTRSNIQWRTAPNLLQHADKERFLASDSTDINEVLQAQDVASAAWNHMVTETIKDDKVDTFDTRCRSVVALLYTVDREHSKQHVFPLPWRCVFKEAHACPESCPQEQWTLWRHHMLPSAGAWRLPTVWRDRWSWMHFGLSYFGLSWGATLGRWNTALPWHLQADPMPCKPWKSRNLCCSRGGKTFRPKGQRNPSGRGSCRASPATSRRAGAVSGQKGQCGKAKRRSRCELVQDCHGLQGHIPQAWFKKKSGLQNTPMLCPEKVHGPRHHRGPGRCSSSRGRLRLPRRAGQERYLSKPNPRDLDDLGWFGSRLSGGGLKSVFGVSGGHSEWRLRTTRRQS